MKSKCAVVFTKNNARMVWYDKIEDLQHFHNVVISADLSYISGVPPHFWKHENGIIREMSLEEKERRVHDINTEGLDVDPKSSQIAAYESRITREQREEKERNDLYEANLQSQFDQVHERILKNSKDVEALKKDNQSSLINHASSVSSDLDYINERIDLTNKSLSDNFVSCGNQFAEHHDKLREHRIDTQFSLNSLLSIINERAKIALVVFSIHTILIGLLTYKVLH